MIGPNNMDLKQGFMYIGSYLVIYLIEAEWRIYAPVN